MQTFTNFAKTLAGKRLRAIWDGSCPELRIAYNLYACGLPYTCS